MFWGESFFGGFMSNQPPLKAPGVAHSKYFVIIVQVTRVPLPQIIPLTLATPLFIVDVFLNVIFLQGPSHLYDCLSGWDSLPSP